MSAKNVDKASIACVSVSQRLCSAMVLFSPRAVNNVVDRFQEGEKQSEAFNRLLPCRFKLPGASSSPWPGTSTDGEEQKPSVASPYAEAGGPGSEDHSNGSNRTFEVVIAPQFFCRASLFNNFQCSYVPLQ